MAQYDGSIRINTEINSKNAKAQLMTLENRIVKTADKIASLRSKMDSLKDAKIPTTEYAALNKEFDKLDTEIGKLVDKQNRFLETGGKKNSGTYKRMEYDLQNLSRQQDDVIAKQKKLQQSGKAFTLGSDTQEYANLGQQLKYAESEMEVLNQKHDVQRLKVEKTESEYAKLGNTARSSLSKIGAVVKESAISSMRKFTNVVKKAGVAIKGIVSKILGIGKSAKSASGSISGMGMSFKNLLKYGLGIRSLYVLVNKLRAGVKEGFKNLAQVSDPVNKSISSLMSALTRLKNSLATAFAPILTAISPSLTTLINMVSKAVTAVGMLIASLTGQKTFTKATSVQEDYAASLDSTAKSAKNANKQLSGLDKLNNLTTQDKDKDSGDGGISPSDMFETVDIPSQIKDFAEMIKKAWEQADFTEIGGLIGKKLKSGLESIPWGDIQKTAEKVGKSFATLINGFVEVPGLATTIGNTIAQAINTGLIGLESFAKNLHWDSVGKFIADGINGALANIDWNTAVSAASYLGTGIATLLNNALTPEVFQNIGTTIGNGLNTALTFAYNFLKTFDWLQFGEGLSDLINTALDTLDTKKLGKTLGAGLRGVVQTAFGFVTNLNFDELGKKIGDAINGFFEEMGKVDKKTGLTGWQELGQTISTSITGILDTINTALSTVNWDEVGKAIGGFVTSVDWDGIFAKTGTVIVKALWSAVKVAASAFASDPLGVSSAIITIMAGWFTISAFSLVTNALKTALQTSLSNAANALETGGIKGILQTKLGKIGAIAVSLTIAVEAIKWAGGLWSDIFKEYTMDEITAGLDEMFADLFGDNFISKGMTGLSLAWGTILSGKYSWEEWGDGLAEFAKDAWDGIKEVFSGVGKWFKNIFSKAWTGIKSVFSSVGSFFSSVWSAITGAFNGTIDWFKDVFSKAWTGIKNAFSAVGSFFSGVWKSITSIFANVASWFKSIFSKAWTAIKNAFSSVGSFFSGVWKTTKSAFSSVGTWFKEKFSSAWTGIKGVFSSVGKFFSGVWSNITGAFGNIAGWFKDKFSAAWTAVKNVFSKGGKIFDGIKDGILSGLKAVINGLISGINKVIAVPFNGLNGALKTLKSISIAGVKPFDWLPTLPVPQIPKLATGAVIPANKEFLAVLGDQKHGRNLEAPEGLIRKIVREETAKNNSGIGEITFKIPVEVDGMVLFELMKKFDLEEYQRTGKPSFQM